MTTQALREAARDRDKAVQDAVRELAAIFHRRKAVQNPACRHPGDDIAECDNDADWLLREVANPTAAAALRDYLAPVEARAELVVSDTAALGAAWKAAEEALPEGWNLELGRLDFDGAWEAFAKSRAFWEDDYLVPDREDQHVSGEGPTPIAALEALRAALTERLREAGRCLGEDYTVKTVDCGIAECGWRGTEHTHSGLRRPERATTGD